MIVYHLRENKNPKDVEWAKKQREIQKRKNHEENQLKIGQNIIKIEKTEEEFDWEQVKIPGLVVKGSAPQEMMTMYFFFSFNLNSIFKDLSIDQLFRRHPDLVIENVMREELMKY